MSEPQRILCVDDEESILKALKRLFFDDDYEVQTSTSGEEAIRMLESGPPPQVVISDYRMPGMNGVMFLRAVSARWPDTVRILLSGYSDVGAIIDAVNDGKIYKFISKPWNDDELKISVANALERWRLYHRNAELTKQLRKANEDLTALNSILQERITDEVASLKTKTESLEQAGSILDLLPLAVVRLDGDGWITYYNKMMTGLFSWGNRDMMFVPRDKAFPLELNGLIDETIKEGGATAPLSINGKAVLTRGERIVSSAGKPGVILVFDAFVTEDARRVS